MFTIAFLSICCIFLVMSIGLVSQKNSVVANASYEQKDASNYHLHTQKQIKELYVDQIAKAWIVHQDSFEVLNGVTCYTLEVWENAMRIPHWHPNASELGYVISGNLEIMIWRSPGETSVFTVGPGMCWFIPQGALHSLNNIGAEKAQLLVGFSQDTPLNVDMPVAYNGVPAPLRNAFTSPHTDLSQWKGTISNPLVGRYTASKSDANRYSGSPYKFDLAQVTPLYNDSKIGSVIWGIKDNWSILENISMLRAHLKPGVSRDAIWYPDAGTLYIVASGKGQFQLVIPDQEPRPFDLAQYDYVFVPVGFLHSFSNNSTEDLEMIAFFTKADPQPEVSLAVASSFFPDPVRKDAMSRYGNLNGQEDPLKDLKFKSVSPYLVSIGK